MGYARTTENEKVMVKKIGMTPIQREGLEYEFTLFLDPDLDHMDTSKDRTSISGGRIVKLSMMKLRVNSTGYICNRMNN